MSVQHPTLKIKSFEGPLDLLLFLISKNKLNILDIPIALILDQYTGYLSALRRDNIEIASEFLEMAARLVYIKTAMLLPKSEESDQLRRELSMQLMEYQVCRLAAARLAELARFDTFVRQPCAEEPDRTYTGTHDVMILPAALTVVTGRAVRRRPPDKSDFARYVKKPAASAEWGIYITIKSLLRSGSVSFENVFEYCNKRDQYVAVFIAVLELIKAGRVEMDAEQVLHLNRNHTAKIPGIRPEKE